jgi:cob(I)alamin adenosyltransferase
LEFRLILPEETVPDAGVFREQGVPMRTVLACPFLDDDSSDLRSDFEILSDEIASMIGLLRSLIDEKLVKDAQKLKDDLLTLGELVYHSGSSLRTRTTVSNEEREWLHARFEEIQAETKTLSPRFVVPQGCVPAAYSHCLRSKTNALIRLLSRYKQQGNPVDDALFDFTSLASNYFFVLALQLNQSYGVKEIAFISRVYRHE